MGRPMIALGSSEVSESISNMPSDSIFMLPAQCSGLSVSTYFSISLGEKLRYFTCVIL